MASVQQGNSVAKLLSTGKLEDNTNPGNIMNDWAIQYLTLPEDGRARFAAQVKANKGQTAGDGSCKTDG